MIKGKLAFFFTPSQTWIIVAIAVAVVLLVILNVILAHIFNRRGERKLRSRQLQQKRELLLKQLEDLNTGKAHPESQEEQYRPFFKNETDNSGTIEELLAEQPDAPQTAKSDSKAHVELAENEDVDVPRVSVELSERDDGEEREDAADFDISDFVDSDDQRKIEDIVEGPAADEILAAEKQTNNRS